MGNSISLEENENMNEDQSIQSSDIEMKSPDSQSEPRENSNNDNDIQPNIVKRSKRASSDPVKKRRSSTSKNGNVNALKKTKSVRRR
jgi:hypothetical protein